MHPALKKYEAIICDGAIRSGKTISMACGFVLWAMRNFDGEKFAICGKTIESLRRNVISLLPKWLEGICEMQERRSDNTLVVHAFGHTNTFHEFGGRDESSYTLIQGITLAGVLLDEVALMPRSFVEQACSRCSIEGSRLWFNCNPEGPQHWFYLEWIQKATKKNALHLHFTMDDNPALADSIRRRYESMYSGVFYRRYILGEWCLAEGLVYDFGEENITDEIPENGEYYISIDYGTLNPFSAGLWCVVGGKAVRIKEYYYSGRGTQHMKTDAEYCDEIEELAKGYEIRRVIVDPSAASFIAALRKRGFRVQQANNSVLDGIRRTAVYLRDGIIKIHRSCVDSIREFGLYRWDEKSTEDRVIKENDHAMDEIRYFANTVIRQKLKNQDYKPLWM